MKNFLPQLNKESCEKALLETESKDFVKNIKSKIKKENEFFYKYIICLAKNLNSADSIDLVVSIYNFIDIQSVADNTKVPVVSKEISGPIKLKLDSLGENGFITKTLKVVKSENPIIHHVIIDYCKEFDDKNDTIMYISLLSYEMLRNQAEADYMNEEIKL